MEVTSLEPDRHVGWRCVQGPEDWVGTNFSFRLEPGTTRGHGGYPE